MCIASRSSALDVSPPAECIDIDHGTYEAQRKHHGSSLVDFDDLMSADVDPPALFTCEREHPVVPTLARYGGAKSPAGMSKQRAALMFAHIGIGMPVAGPWVTGKVNAERSMDMQAQCEAGERIACARVTWMAECGSSLDVLVLADCSNLRCSSQECEQEHKRRGKGSYGRYLFDRASWLGADPKLPSLHLRCYWGTYEGLGLSYRKTATLFRALFEQLQNKHIYVKVDADAIIRPNNLLRFLSVLQQITVPNAAFYFGSAYGTYACTGGERRGDQCRAFTFNKGFRGMKNWTKGRPRSALRLRESHEWNKLQRSMLTGAGDRLANQTAVTYALGGVYGVSSTALARLVQSNCQPRVARLRCDGAACARTVRNVPFHTHEDANMGLCMHLNGVRMVQCGCFHMMNIVEANPLRRTWSIPARVNVRSASSVKAYFKDGRPEDSRAPQLCKHPIAVHPIKHMVNYLRVWQALATRDAVHDEHLRTWQQSAATSRNETAIRS